MLLQGYEKKSNVVILDYESTWDMSQEIVFDATQVIIDIDLKDTIQRYMTVIKETKESVDRLAEIKEHEYNLLSCDFIKDGTDVVVVAGKSTIMEVPIQVAFYVGTRQVRLFVSDINYFEKNGRHVFDNYMCSIEINAYCKHTERKVLSEK